MSDEKRRHTVWLSDGAWGDVKAHYRRNNCSTQNEFIEKAIRFYCGYLDAESDGSYLPRVLSEMLEGKLTLLGDRIGRLLYKQVVEQSMMTHIIAADTDIDEETLEKLRGRCVRDVQRTNGQITFREILRFQKSP
jgi:hypothetical protein